MRTMFQFRGPVMHPRMGILALLVLVGVLPGAMRVNAHHSASAQFDNTKTFTARGTVYKVEMTNPHGWLHLTVKGPDGRAKSYSFQTSAPSQLLRRGVDKHFLIGNTLVVDAWPSRDGSNTALAVTIKQADGTVIATIEALDPAGAAARGEIN